LVVRHGALAAHKRAADAGVRLRHDFSLLASSGVVIGRAAAHLIEGETAPIDSACIVTGNSVTVIASLTPPRIEPKRVPASSRLVCGRFTPG
jgi:hypothetical protein